MTSNTGRSREFLGSTALARSVSPALSNRKADYAAGMSVCLRIIYSQKDATAEKKMQVFQNQATEVATFIKSGGTDKIEAVDSLANAAESIGIDADTVQMIMADALKGEGQTHEATGSCSSQQERSGSHSESSIIGKASTESLLGWRRSIISASELKAKTFKPISYVVPGYIPEGVTIFAGKPKIGKSWLLFDVCLASAAGRFVLGRIKPVEGDVLYLALEDSQRRLKRRLAKLWPEGTWPQRLTLATEWRRADAGGAEDIADWCDSVANPVLVVVDTLERFRPPGKPGAPAYTTDYLAISALHKLAHERGISVVVIHHVRKMEADDPFDMVSGTNGLTGAADTILILKRQAGNVTLYARGRDIDEKETACQFDKSSCRWTLLGDAGQVHSSGERAAIVAALRPAGETGLHIAEIMAATERRDRNAVDQLLFKMQRDGELVRVRRGVYAASGKIGKKERNDAEPPEKLEETTNLTNLTDLTGPDDPHRPEAVQ